MSVDALLSSFEQRIYDVLVASPRALTRAELMKHERLRVLGSQLNSTLHRLVSAKRVCTCAVATADGFEMGYLAEPVIRPRSRS